MTVKRRIRTIRLSEKINHYSEYAKNIGVSVELKHEGSNSKNNEKSLESNEGRK